jgi:hypothetical protein
MRMSPFRIVYGFDPDIDVPTQARGEPSEGRVPAAIDAAKRVRDTHEELAKRWREASERQASYHNARHQAKTYKIGDKVLLSAKNLRLAVPKKKLAPRFLGPFRVLDAVWSQAYRLALPSHMKIHNVFHVSLLEPWYDNGEVAPEESMPLADDTQEWAVEKILDSKVVQGKRYLLVKWEGWPDEYTQWEPEENCENAYDLIVAYEAQAKKQRGTRGRKKKM